MKILESRMPANGQARFGGGPEEKGDNPYLACGLPNKNLTSAFEDLLHRQASAIKAHWHTVSMPMNYCRQSCHLRRKLSV
jgi:hypothetical protein